MTGQATDVYHAHGVRFQYPAGWDVSEQRLDRELSISVESAGTSNWSLTLLFDRPDPDHVVASVVAAFREEYDELDVYDTRSELCGRGSIARDVEFVCLELINAAFVRAFRTVEFTALVLYQGTDRELDETRSVMDAISASLECDEDD